MKKSTLFSEFKEQSKAEWLAKVEKDLKGKPLEGLNWDFFDTNMNPFFHADDLEEKPMALSNGQADNRWEIGEMIVVTDIKAANEQALFALERGANALCFLLEKSPKQEELTALLKGIQHEWISTNFILKQDSWKRLATNFIKMVKEKGQDLSQVACSFQFEGHPFSNPAEIESFKNIVSQLPKGHFLMVDVKDEKNPVTALATAIHKGNTLLSQIHDADLDLATLHSNIQFSMALDDDYFLNIAKIRALKLLWQQVLSAWNADLNAHSPIEVHLTKSHQTEDEHYNKIKASSQAMSAVMGGAHRLYVHPSDSFKTENGTAFSRRIALNINHLLQQESYLDRVIDPSAGSYYIETLTDNLAEKAWEKFQELV